MLHPLLSRQVQRVGANADAPPSLDAWRAILERISRSYEDSDQYRYTIERSLAISSREMEGLHQGLRSSAQAENALRTRLEALVSSIGDGLCFVDGDGQPALLNPAALELLGLAETGGGAGAPCTRERLEAALGGVGSPVVRALGSDEGCRIERAVLLRGDGTTFPAACVVTPVRSGDARLGAVLLFRDTTERERIEAELVCSRDRAESAARAKSDFLATMSHEIRTPLNGVIGMAGLLLQLELSAEQRDCAEVIQTSAGALLLLLNDILDFSKIEAGRFELEAHDFSPVGIVEEVLDLFAQKAQEKGLALASLVDVDVPELARGDAARIRQVLVNVVGNAVKFTEAGEVVVRIVAGPTPDVLAFEVRDSGPGIPEATAARLFQPFTQADSSTTRRFGGTGLGLAISRRLVEMMGGTIGVAESSPRGSTFRFDVRLGRAESQPGPLQRLDGRTFVVCEPHAATRQGLAREIERLGARCHAFADLATARASMGEDLGIHDGWILSDEFARGFAEGDSADRDRVVRLSGWAARLEESRRTGGERLLSRPFRRKELQAALGLLARGPDLERPKSLATTRARAPLENHANSRVLLVEDNAVNQKIARKILERLGLARIDVARNGAEAVAAVGHGSYDLVLMDCQMPEMDGFEATRRIRALGGACACVPIVAMTANAMRGDRERCLDSGMDEYLTKPIRPEVLSEAIGRLLARARAGAPPGPARTIVPATPRADQRPRNG